MPREKLHWSVLDEAIERLGNDSPLKEILTPNKPARMLGAMTHDAPYYYKLGGAPQEKIGAVLHGSYKNDTFLPLRKLAKDIFEQGKNGSNPQSLNSQWAFLLGMTSHFSVDIIFHPLIYFFTGDYYVKGSKERSDVRRKHRLLEVYLDQYVSAEKPKSLLLIKKELGEDFNKIARLLNRNILPEHFSELESEVPDAQKKIKFWREALIYLVVSQVTFNNNLAGSVFRVLSLVLANKFLEIDALFSYKRESYNDFFKNSLTYKNPVSGDESSKSIDELREDAIEKTLSIFEKFENIDFKYRDESTLQSLDEIEGASLNFGLSGTDKTSPKYFSKKGLELQGLAVEPE